MSADATLAEAPSKARLRLWLRLLKTTGRIESDLRRRMRDHGTTLPRFDVMAALARHPDGLRMSDLSFYLQVSNGNVTGIVDRLCDEGLARRLSVPGDRRAQRVTLTEAGTAAFDDLAARHEAWIDELLGALSPVEVRAAIALLDKHVKADTP